MKNKIPNLKYMTFLALLAVMGIGYLYREPLEDFLDAAIEFGLKNYEESIDLPGEPLYGEKDADGDGSDGADGSPLGEDGSEQKGSDAQTGDDPQTDDPSEKGHAEVNGTVSGGDAAQWEYASVEKSYFDDALFIGDSRTVGLQDYAGLDNATFYASTGLTIYKLFDAEIAPVEGSHKKQTVEQALSERQFGKIYLMIGINEMGTGTVESFMKKYDEAVKHLQELQPDAIIYLQAIMKVSAERSAKGDYIYNEGIEQRNAEIAKLADNQQIFFLDVNPYVCDDGGGLVSDYTFDGVHLKAAYIEIWKQFLMDHTIRFLE